MVAVCYYSLSLGTCKSTANAFFHYWRDSCFRITRPYRTRCLSLGGSYHVSSLDGRILRLLRLAVDLKNLPRPRGDLGVGVSVCDPATLASLWLSVRLDTLNTLNITQHRHAVPNQITLCLCHSLCAARWPGIGLPNFGQIFIILYPANRWPWYDMIDMIDHGIEMACMRFQILRQFQVVQVFCKRLWLSCDALLGETLSHWWTEASLDQLKC